MDNFEFDIDKALNDLENLESLEEHKTQAAPNTTNDDADASEKERTEVLASREAVPDLLGDLKELSGQPGEAESSRGDFEVAKETEPSSGDTLANLEAKNESHLDQVNLLDISNDDNEMVDLMKSLEINQQDLFKKGLQKQLDEREKQNAIMPATTSPSVESELNIESKAGDNQLLIDVDKQDEAPPEYSASSSSNFNDRELLNNHDENSSPDQDANKTDDNESQALTGENQSEPGTQEATNLKSTETNSASNQEQADDDDSNPFSDPFERLAKLSADADSVASQETSEMVETSSPAIHETVPKPADIPVQVGIKEEPAGQEASSNPEKKAQEPIVQVPSHAPIKQKQSVDSSNFLDSEDTVPELVEQAAKPHIALIAKIASIESQDETFFSGNDDSECFFDTVENPIGSIGELVAPHPNTIMEALEEELEKKDTPVSSWVSNEPAIIEIEAHARSGLVLGQSEETTNATQSTQISDQTDNIPREADIHIDLNDNPAQVEPQGAAAPVNELEESNHQIVSTEAFVNEILNINEQHLQPSNNASFDHKEKQDDGSNAEASNNNRKKIAVIQVVDFETEWAQLTDREKSLGLIAPAWVADSESDACMKCSLKFTFSRRRHHCRACGLLFCSNCCHLKLPLAYQTVKGVTTSVPGALTVNDSGEIDIVPTPTPAITAPKEVLSRVCNECYGTIKKVSDLKTNMMNQSKRTVPTVSVLKKRSSDLGAEAGKNGATRLNETGNAVESSSGSKLTRSKSVRFSDGLAPGLEENPRLASERPPPSTSNPLETTLTASVTSENALEAPASTPRPAPSEPLPESSDLTASSSNPPLPGLEPSQASVVPVGPSSSHETSATTTESKPPSKKKDKSSKSKSSSHLLTKKYKISNKHVYRQSRMIEEELITRIKVHYLANDFLPPLLVEDAIIDASQVDFDEEKLIKERFINASHGNQVAFLLLRNLKVFLRLVKFECCTKSPCWVFTTSGLCMNGQEELVYVLKCNLDENGAISETRIAKQILYHVMDVFEKTLKGYRIRPMSHLLYDFETKNKLNSASKGKDQEATDGQPSSATDNIFLENKENIGFIYFQSSADKSCCLNRIRHFLPSTSYLIGLLIQKWEIPWAKLFPLRLFLRLGAETNVCYPIVSDRNRRSVYGDIGQTIMSLLCDVRNFQYTIAQINGLYIQIDGQSARISIPESQYDLIIKSMLTSNEYVFSMASLEIDDTCPCHLVAIENENLGSYASKVINFDHDASLSQDPVEDSTPASLPRAKSTGAAFVVFNGAMKTNLAMNAKLSIVEDGIMIQIDSDTMNKLKESLKSMKPFRIECMKPLMVGLSSGNVTSNQTQSESTITIEWIKEDRHINKDVCSIIDSMSFCGVKSLNLNNAYDYVNETRGIRWIQIHLIHVEDDTNAIAEQNFNLNRFADLCSQAGCTALAPLLDDLAAIQYQHLVEKSHAAGDEAQGACGVDESRENEARNIPRSIDPFPVALRIQVNKDQFGYLIGMNGFQITDERFAMSLDNELIQLLNHAAQFNISISFELVFFVQERFNCSNQFLRNKSS